MFIIKTINLIIKKNRKGKEYSASIAERKGLSFLFVCYPSCVCVCIYIYIYVIILIKKLKRCFEVGFYRKSKIIKK